MSSANLNTNGTLRCGKLVLAGQTIVPGAITTTVLTGQTGAGASGAVAVSSTVTNTAGPAVPLAFASTANSLTLTGNIPPGGAGGGTTVPTLWSNTSAYAVGAVVSVGSLASPTGTFICILAVGAGAPTNPAPSADATHWTPVAPLAGASAGVASVGGGTVVAPATGAITLVGAGGITVSGAGGPAGSITLTGSATAGVASLAGTGPGPTLATGAIAFSSSVTSGATTALTWISSANGMELAGTVAGGAGGLPSIYYTENKTWTTAGATDTIVLTSALPAGTYLPLVSWTTANAALIVGALSAVVPVAGGGLVGSPLQILCSGAVVTTAGSTYSYTLLKLT